MSTALPDKKSSKHLYLCVCKLEVNLVVRDDDN
jgi:hypothetical protein